MRFVLLLLASLSAGPALAEDYVSPRGFAPVPVPRPSEPQAAYTLVDAWKTGGTRVQFVSRRAGPSGLGYTRREIDCRSGIGRTLASSETVASLQRDAPDPRAIAPVPGSSAQLTSAAACRAMGY